MQSSRQSPARMRFGQYLTRRANQGHSFIITQSVKRTPGRAMAATAVNVKLILPPRQSRGGSRLYKNFDSGRRRGPSDAAEMGEAESGYVLHAIAERAIDADMRQPDHRDREHQRRFNGESGDHQGHRRHVAVG